MFVAEVNENWLLINMGLPVFSFSPTQQIQARLKPDCIEELKGSEP